MSKTPQSFDDAILRLEALTQQIQSNETPLEVALKNYEEGRKLVQFCRQKLAEVEQQDRVGNLLPTLFNSTFYLNLLIIQ